MSRAASPSRDRTRGAARVRGAWSVARARVRRRRGPAGACPDAALVAHVAAGIAAAPFAGEGCRELWARLRHKGARAAGAAADEGARAAGAAPGPAVAEPGP